MILRSKFEGFNQVPPGLWAVLPRQLPYESVQPTQLYLSSEKLAGVFEWFDFDSPNYDPLPAFTHKGDWYLSDGHGRAFAAGIGGTETLQIQRDRDVREEYNIEVYRTCIEWCAEAGIETVHDLNGRIVEPDTYQTLWIDRCQELVSDS
jgi:hypothetical protein